MVRPSFFWYDTDFSKKKNLNLKNNNLKSRCHTKRKVGRGARHSFGMTMTQDIRDLFA